MGINFFTPLFIRTFVNQPDKSRKYDKFSRILIWKSSFQWNNSLVDGETLNSKNLRNIVLTGGFYRHFPISVWTARSTRIASTSQLLRSGDISLQCSLFAKSQLRYQNGSNCRDSRPYKIVDIADRIIWALYNMSSLFCNNGHFFPDIFAWRRRQLPFQCQSPLAPRIILCFPFRNKGFNQTKKKNNNRESGEKCAERRWNA